METVMIDNPKKITMNKRLVVAGAGLVAGGTLGYFLFRDKNFGVDKKNMLMVAAVISLSAFTFTYITNPPKIRVEAKK